jgi:beta-xylosidase
VTTTLPPPPAAPGGSSVAPVEITYPSGTGAPGGCTDAGPNAEDPVCAGDFPDPYVVAIGGTYYAYSTGSGFTTAQVMSSPDLVDWTMLGDAMGPPTDPVSSSTGPDGNKWAVTSFNTWAPAVVAETDGTFTMYYAALDRASQKHCIGRATSTKPEGPFVDTSNAALICTPDRGGSIDPEPFTDTAGNRYLLWKSEGIAGSEPTRLWIVKLNANGSLAESPTAHELLSTAAGSWEEPITESPSMMPDPSGAGYLLFYSGSSWETAGYAVGVARCAVITGPCTRIYSTPVLASRGNMVGPGGEHVFRDLSGNWQVAFASWTGSAGYQTVFPGVPLVPHVRSLHFLRLSFPDGKNPAIG